ncbi:glycosyltransferase family 2 protein [Flaviaesturariibacter amylovorans]|uniref:Glycosyltransferase family 2 protein n=1 Tax=Flaviaesturariibacter amylovorans TaxID=1084520 RepID=A0ABP8GRV5_9BACT
MKGISAVVATYKRKKELRRLFDSILAYPLKDLELIIVDQNRDGLLDDLIAEFTPLLTLRHIKMEEANQSKARNLGARAARYDVICFPDDDCWFDPGALQAVQRHFESPKAADLLIINWVQGPITQRVSRLVTQKELFSFRSVGYVTYVQFYRSAVFHELGGFLENVGIGQFIGGGEDSELTFRAMQRGYRIFFDADIRVNHYYIPVLTRQADVIRARQRGMGMVYAAYDIPYHVILKGMMAPLVKMVLSMNRKRSGDFYNMFRGRLEGFVHTMRKRKSEAPLLQQSN